MAKTVLITGATQGIGAATAIAFAKAGYQVAINCRSEASRDAGGSKVLAECKAAGATAQCFVADVSDFEQCAKLVKDVCEAFGTVDVLVNNAGITKDGLIARMSEENFDAVINVNLKSVFNMIRQVTPVMMKKRSGTIINYSSVAGVHGNAGQLNYSASKAGVIGMTKTTAKELGGRGITCNAIAPGFIESAMTQTLPEATKEAILGATSLRRFGKPEDVANTAVFLASEAASFITGQVLVVDGGLQM